VLADSAGAVVKPRRRAGRGQQGFGPGLNRRRGRAFGDSPTLGERVHRPAQSGPGAGVILGGPRRYAGRLRTGKKVSGVRFSRSQVGLFVGCAWAPAPNAGCGPEDKEGPANQLCAGPRGLAGPRALVGLGQVTAAKRAVQCAGGGCGCSRGGLGPSCRPVRVGWTE